MTIISDGMYPYGHGFIAAPSWKLVGKVSDPAPGCVEAFAALLDGRIRQPDERISRAVREPG